MAVLGRSRAGEKAHDRITHNKHRVIFVPLCRSQNRARGNGLAKLSSTSDDVEALRCARGSETLEL